jgi:peptidoglycan/xylan/chitin deacetylase (PgdA/CDA1 family)
MTDPLDAEIASLAEAATKFDARHETIPDLRWPDGVRIAVNFTADFDAMLLRRLLNEPPMQLAKGEFGGRVGIWRLIELFDSHAVKATIFTPGRIAELYPQALRAAVASGHELADHMWEHHVPKEAALEADHLKRTIGALEPFIGHRPVGTRSHHTPALLAQEGYLYTSNHYADHRPYYLWDAARKHRLLNLPFHYAIDDAMFYSFAWLGSSNPAQRLSDTDRVEEIWWDAFWQQYQQGGYLNICLHPFVSGRALRIDMLDRLICRMKRLPGVWFPSCETVARHVLANHPPKNA